MLNEQEREIAERAKRILERASQLSAKEYFEDMIRRGVIDSKGQLLRNGAKMKTTNQAKNHAKPEKEG